MVIELNLLIYVLVASSPPPSMFFLRLITKISSLNQSLLVYNTQTRHDSSMLYIEIWTPHPQINYGNCLQIAN